MNHDRLTHLFQAETTTFNDLAMPCNVGASVTTPKLVACVIHPSLMLPAQGLYQLAYEQAMAATRTSRLERLSKVCLN